jgi:hypothetical protein
MSTNRYERVADRAQPAPVPVATTIPKVQKGRYTIDLSPALQAMADEDVQRLRRDTGRRVVRSDVIRELLRVLHADETLYAELRRRIEQS